MHKLDFIEEDGTDTVFRDVIFLALAGFVAIVILLLPHLNPPAVAEEAAPSPGNIIVEVHWANAIDADVDLWVEAPGDIPVGYSNKGGTVFNLLRDDLGGQSDLTEMNYEVTYSRGVPVGEYTINVHLYRDLAKKLPFPVTVVVSVKKTESSSVKQILTTKVMFTREGQEITAFRFKLDGDGQLETGSVHDLPRKLRSKSS